MIAAAEPADYLSPGVHLHVWGHGVTTRHGTTAEVDEMAEAGDE